MLLLVQRAFIWVTLLAVGVTCISLGAGTLREHTSNSVMARNSCELPCAFGVVPGETERETAEDIYGEISIKPASFMTALQDSYTLRVTDSEIPASDEVLAMVLFQKPLGGIVRAVRLYKMSTNLWQLGDLLAQQGEPDRVFASCDSSSRKLLLIFGDNTIAEVNPIVRLSPDMEITRIAVTADVEATLAPLLASFACPTETAWHGFAAYWVYQAEA